VAVAELRRGEWGSLFPAELVRDFIRSALQHPAANDVVSEYIFDIATGEDEPPTDIGEALQVAIGEVLSAATADDWKQVACDLLADARDCVGDDSLPAAPQPEEAIPAAWWPPLPGRSRRKPHVHVRQEAILEWLTQQGSATTAEIAEHFGISKHTARMKTDGLVAQGKLTVTPGARAKGSRPVIERRYSVPSPADSPVEGNGELPAALEEGAQEIDLPFRRDRARRCPPDPSPRSRQMTTEETEELAAEIAVGEKYGEKLWRVKEVETGNVLRDAITSEREYRWLLDAFNHGEDYANEQQAQRDAAASAGA
jgi:DeoR-like helix-turn-helix domain